MFPILTVAVAVVVALEQGVPAPPPAGGQSPAAATPAAVDPATSAFTTDTGVILVTVKPAMTAAYEEVLRALQEAMAKDSDVRRRSAADGWRVFKAAEADAKGNAVYVHLMRPAVPDFDYRPSLLLDALVEDLTPTLLTQYQQSIAGAPSKLSLTEVAHMAVAPVPLPEPKKPGPQ